jgi:hypothetical protein
MGENLIPGWWSGNYLPMPVAGRPAGSLHWERAHD